MKERSSHSGIDTSFKKAVPGSIENLFIDVLSHDLKQRLHTIGLAYKCHSPPLGLLLEPLFGGGSNEDRWDLSEIFERVKPFAEEKPIYLWEQVVQEK